MMISCNSGEHPCFGIKVSIHIHWFVWYFLFTFAFVLRWSPIVLRGCGVHIFPLDLMSFSLVLVLVDTFLLKIYQLWFICSKLKIHKAKLRFSIRFWDLSKCFEGLIWWLILESFVWFKIRTMKQKVFWVKLTYFG